MFYIFKHRLIFTSVNLQAIIFMSGIIGTRYGYREVKLFACVIFCLITHVNAACRN